MARWTDRLKFWKRGPRHKFSGDMGLAELLGHFQRPGEIGEDYLTQARQGYLKNLIAYRCIKETGQAVASIPYFVRQGGKDVEGENDLTKLLRRPNPRKTWRTMVRDLMMHRLINGNCYLRAIKVSTGRVMELHVLRPDRVRVITAQDCTPIAYEYTIDGRPERFPIDPLTGASEILHMKEPNPLSDLYGLSPIQAASVGIGQHTESAAWNLNLLKNSARPPGVITMEPMGQGSIPPGPEEMERLAEKFNEKYSGSRNAGRIPFLSFAMKWQGMGMSPKDMDWLNGKNSSARDVAQAFGYPPFLLGLPEGSTFDNVREAKLHWYQGTVVPLCQETDEEIAHWLTQLVAKPGQGRGEIEIIPDLDVVDALALQRQPILEQSRLDFEAGIISANEAREVRRYDPVPDGDDLLVPAGKLPLGFDPGELDGDLSDKQFRRWLIQQGLSLDQINKIVRASGHRPEPTRGDLPEDAGGKGIPAS